jgi:hypothetical protein
MNKFMRDSLSATVLDSDHTVEPTKFPFGFQIHPHPEGGYAMLQVITESDRVVDAKTGRKAQRSEYAGPYNAEVLRCAAKVLYQAARTLDAETERP